MTKRFTTIMNEIQQSIRALELARMKHLNALNKEYKDLQIMNVSYIVAECFIVATMAAALVGFLTQ